MILTEAQKILSNIISPYSYDDFFNNIVGHKPLALLDNANHQRSQILGVSPKQVILNSFEKYAPELTSHIHTAVVPPPKARAVESAQAFQNLINEYHKTGYTVRIPNASNLSPELSQFNRALELLLETTVDVVVFWSDTDAKAPIHHDEVDVIVIQLIGNKKWYISDEQPSLPNKWKGHGQKAPELGRYSTYDVQPGDLLYIPRGTPHTVHSTSESLHLSIGFVPVTLRDAINSVLDHLSEIDRPLRENLGIRADNLSKQQNISTILEQIKLGIDKLNNSCKSDSFIQDSLDLRRSRMIFDLPKLDVSKLKQPISISTRVKHNPLAIAQLVTTTDIIDFRQPSEQTLIHLGVEDCMRFIMNTSTFVVSDIPGDVGDDIRIALVNKMLMNGFLMVI